MNKKFKGNYFTWRDETTPPDSELRKEKGHENTYWPKFHYAARISDFEVALIEFKGKVIVQCKHFYLGWLRWSNYMTVTVPFEETYSFEKAEEEIYKFVTEWEKKKEEHLELEALFEGVKILDENAISD